MHTDFTVAQQQLNILTPSLNVPFGTIRSEGVRKFRKYGGPEMSDSVLRSKALDFSVLILDLVKELKQKGETIIANQIGRSGTSIGANLFEAQHAQGKADFISKLQTSLKEAAETGYWLELLVRTNAISQEQYNRLDTACTALRVMLISSVRTLKNADQSTVK